LRERGLAGKTIDTRTTVVAQFLGANNLTPRLKAMHKPTVEEEPPTPYTKDELDALFSAMTDAERIRCRFFLKTGCREQEVQYASWKDIDFTHKTYTVRAKKDFGFAPKNHESRVIPLRDDLVNELKAYQEQNGDSRWVFPSERGLPDAPQTETDCASRRVKLWALPYDDNGRRIRRQETEGSHLQDAASLRALHPAPFPQDVRDTLGV
jgi:integrase